MKLSRARTQQNLPLVPLSTLSQRVRFRILGEDSSISVDLLDAGVRGLAVVMVLALSLFVFRGPVPSVFGIAVEPVYLALSLALYNLLVVVLLGVPWRNPPRFGLFVVDWIAVSAAIVLAGGLFSPFIILYYALIIGAALRVGLSRSLLLVAGCAIVYAAASLTGVQTVESLHLPVLAVGITSLFMVAITAVAMKRAVEVEVRRSDIEEQTAGQLRLLNNLTRVVLSGSPDLERVMRTVAAVSSQAVSADSGLTVLFDSSTLDDYRGYRGHEGAYRSLLVADRDPNPLRLALNEERLAAEAARVLLPVQTARRGDERFPGLEREGVSVEAIACVPFLLSGGVIGVLFVGRHEPRPFGEGELNLLAAIAQQMAVAVRLARLYDMERERASRSEEREQLERDLLSMVSHELRTPLTSIKTCVGALSSREGQNPTEEKLLHNIGRSTDRLIVLVNELLDMARLRAGRVSLNLQHLHMGEVLTDMAAQVKPLLDARRQTLNLDLPAPGGRRWNELTVLADRRRIEQVLLNLLSNANKYTPVGGMVTLGATPREGLVRIFVRDDGPGIDNQDQQFIFEKFYRGIAHHVPNGPETRAEGTGLGLAIARSIVELHGGTIGVRSRPGRGSTFFFTLDQYEAGEWPHPQAAALRQNRQP